VTNWPQLKLPRVEIAISESAQRRLALSWHPVVLGAVILATTVVRVWVIDHRPEPDGDAKGHLGIAHALLSNPLNVAVHWVWPPGYHYLLAGLLALGVTAHGIRLLNCTLAALLPVLVWRYGETTLQPSASRMERLAPICAGVLCAAMPIVNVLGTSAQQGTLFAILILVAVWGIDTGRFALSGAMLAVATMIRYEAFGAVGLLAGLQIAWLFPSVVRRLPSALVRLCRLPVVVVAPALVTVAAWLLAHRASDGTWFGFLRELYRYTHVQRETFFHHDAWTDFLFFPVIQPYYLFGMTLPLVLLGARRAWRPGFIVPLGIYLFLLGSYTCKGVLANDRYYESLTPFLCVSAAYGALAVGRWWRPATPVAFAAAFAHVVRLLVQTGQWKFHLVW
jgi:hypothetical protein